MVTLYLPLAVFVFVLLFPFYWMAITAFKPNHELLSREGNPFWVVAPDAGALQVSAVRHAYPGWLWNTMLVSVVATFAVAGGLGVRRLCDRAAALPAARARSGLSIFLAYLVPPSILFIPLALDRLQARPVRHPLGADPDLSDFLIPFCTWLLMGYFRSIPYELEECALIDGATRLQILWKIILPLAVPGLISAGIFAFTLSWNEFIYALTFVSSSEIKTVPVGVVTELVEGDVYHWGPLMAGALLGSLPVAIIYSFFVEYYVSGMTGAVKE